MNCNRHFFKQSSLHYFYNNDWSTESGWLKYIKNSITHVTKYNRIESTSIIINEPYYFNKIVVYDCTNLKKICNLMTCNELLLNFCCALYHILLKTKSYEYFELFYCDRLCKIPKNLQANRLIIYNNNMLLQIPKVLSKTKCSIFRNPLAYIPYYVKINNIHTGEKSKFVINKFCNKNKQYVLKLLLHIVPECISFIIANY